MCVCVCGVCGVRVCVCAQDECRNTNARTVQEHKLGLYSKWKNEAVWCGWLKHTSFWLQYLLFLLLSSLFGFLLKNFFVPCLAVCLDNSFLNTI